MLYHSFTFCDVKATPNRQCPIEPSLTYICGHSLSNYIGSVSRRRHPLLELDLSDRPPLQLKTATTNRNGGKYHTSLCRE